MNRETLLKGIELIAQSPEETETLGEQLAPLFTSGDKLLLYGEPGAGKTALTRGICHGLGFTGYVTSPTFAIVNEYDGPTNVYHFDLYRITPDDLYDIGVEEYLAKAGICIFEWPDGAEDIFTGTCIEIRIEKTGEAFRKFSIRGWEAAQ
ncbi:MAG: tRNA (adenosine(37)-N6)-threonylcarbamoyltransferase complex ATPase subunit type 1 TsaE [Clostridiales bacterium]|nr:tRNA (adenosine(37)-N6)-threonylcarbamoyltransferase complex ATPase subunit type 1 TsaE [Clostridiales bacterium]